MSAATAAVPEPRAVAQLDPLVPRPIDLPTPVLGADTDALDVAKILAPPADPARWPAWRDAIVAWRGEARHRVGHRDDAYRDPATAWASRCFSVALTWLWDERLFDHRSQRFTPERWLAASEPFGGFDAVVLWHAYPIIGIDERNQYDFYRDVPGLADLVAWFHDHGLRVFVDYNPWDVGHDAVDADVGHDAVDADVGHDAVDADVGHDAVDHPAETAAVATALGADGVFLDTMRQGGTELVAALRSTSPPMVLEGESKVSLERIADHQISWAQWFADTTAPGVLRAHWFERGHMQHHTRRWNRDHSDELQSAWMNGVGIVVWDAVFGSWVGWNARDRSTLRAMVRAQRALADVLLDGAWTPLTDAAPGALDAGVFVSRWQHADVTLWTAINRGGGDFCGRLLDGAGDDHGAATKWFDVTSGRALTGADDDVVVPARGIAGIVRVVGDVDAGIARLVADAAADERSTDATFPERIATREPVEPSASPPPADAIALVPGWRHLSVTARVRETGLYGGAPYVEEWKPLPPRLHGDVSDTVAVDIGAVAVARREVTAGEFVAFLDRTGFRPLADQRLGLVRRRPDEAPATFVGLADARAYAAAVGARLPTEFEWQVAAEDPSFERVRPAVWNWTESEHSDGVTRYVMLKGGSDFHATASDWYFDGGPRGADFVAKLLLAGLGVERSSNIGFRLAWDVR